MNYKKKYYLFKLKTCLMILLINSYYFWDCNINLIKTNILQPNNKY